MRIFLVKYIRIDIINFSLKVRDSDRQGRQDGRCARADILRRTNLRIWPQRGQEHLR